MNEVEEPYLGRKQSLGFGTIEANILPKNYIIPKKDSSRPKTANTRVIDIPNLKDIKIKTMEILKGISTLTSSKSDSAWNKKSFLLSPLATTATNQVYQGALNIEIPPDSGGDYNNLPVRSGRVDPILEPSKNSFAYKKKKIYKITKKRSTTDDLIYKSTSSIMRINPNIIAIGANPNKVILN